MWTQKSLSAPCHRSCKSLKLEGWAPFFQMSLPHLVFGGCRWRAPSNTLLDLVTLKSVVHDSHHSILIKAFSEPFCTVWKHLHLGYETILKQRCIECEIVNFGFPNDLNGLKNTLQCLHLHDDGRRHWGKLVLPTRSERHLCLPVSNAAFMSYRSYRKFDLPTC